MEKLFLWQVMALGRGKFSITISESLIIIREYTTYIIFAMYLQDFFFTIFNRILSMLSNWLKQKAQLIPYEYKC